MERRTRRNRPESSTRGEGADTQFSDMPSGVLGDVGRSAATDDPVETSNNLYGLRSVSASVGGEFATSNAGQFHTRLNRLGDSAERMFTAAIPPNNHVPVSQPFHERYCPVGPITKFQTATRKSAAVDKVLGMNSALGQSLALSNIAGHIGDFGQADRERLLDRSIELAETFGNGQAEALINSCAALKKGRDYLSEQQSDRVDAMLAQSDYIRTLYESFPEASGHAMQQPQNPDLDRSIEAIYARSRQLQPDWTYQQADTIGETGELINQAYNSARAELMGTDRTRDLTR
ncbi:hypothetical protein [Mesorhizobium sp. WSM3626]|uniref:hypothetical protein n=1 Tax=Mesorhizobium sp. WSM3626 TaxID=1040987 RepID=UPI0012EBFF2C|nr:hypothetical protein [Mesorhizobium sp. WSM3626]